MAQRKATAKAIPNFRRMMNLNVKFDKDTHSTEVILPGLSYDDFDRTGNPSIWKTMRQVELERIYDRSIAIQMEAEKRESIVLVMLGQRFHISPEFYTYARLKSPMIYNTQTTHIGKYSVSNKITLQNFNTKSALLTNVYTLAGMHSKTGRSHPLPSSLTEQMQARNIGSRPTPLPTLELPPSGQYYRWSVRAAHSDMDHLFHINSATYVRYCMDCATEASLSGFTKGITGDPCFLQVSRIETFHSGENFAGDELDVCTWESSDDKSILNFLIFNKKRPTQPVFHCWILFR